MTSLHEWIESGLLLIIAGLAAANAALRQAQRDQAKLLERSNRISHQEQRTYRHNTEFQQQLISSYQAMLKEREGRIQELTHRLNALKYLCDN